jgi:hypothetical protein
MSLKQLLEAMIPQRSELQYEEAFSQNEGVCRRSLDESILPLV